MGTLPCPAFASQFGIVATVSPDIVSVGVSRIPFFVAAVAPLYSPLAWSSGTCGKYLEQEGSCTLPVPMGVACGGPCAVRVTTTVDHPGAPLLSLPCRPRRDNCFCVFRLCERAPMWPAPCLSLYLSLFSLFGGVPLSTWSAEGAARSFLASQTSSSSCWFRAQFCMARCCFSFQTFAVRCSPPAAH